MFRPVYWRIATTLIASTLTLLIVVDSVVYGALNQVVQRDEESQLTSDLVDLRETLGSCSYFAMNHGTRYYNYVDELGEHDYFIIYRGGYTAVRSTLMPVPATTVRQAAGKSQYSYLLYKGEPYRIKQEVILTAYGPIT